MMDKNVNTNSDGGNGKDIIVSADLLSNLVLNGDISKLTEKQKVQYYNHLCDSLSLNPLTKPFDIIKFQGKEILYAKKDATEQLRKLNGVSVVDMQTTIEKDIIITKVKVQDKSGRLDISTGAVNIKGLSGDALANATMKSETKAKRRATLSICGLGILDETELETLPKFEDKAEAKIKKEFNGEEVKLKLTKEEAQKKLDALPDNIKEGFKSLNYDLAKQWEICTKHNWNNAEIYQELNNDAIPF